MFPYCNYHYNTYITISHIDFRTVKKKDDKQFVTNLITTYKLWFNLFLTLICTYKKTDAGLFNKYINFYEKHLYLKI